MLHLIDEQIFACAPLSGAGGLRTNCPLQSDARCAEIVDAYDVLPHTSQ
jgi:hypothetical protein